MEAAKKATIVLMLTILWPISACERSTDWLNDKAMVEVEFGAEIAVRGSALAIGEWDSVYLLQVDVLAWQLRRSELDSDWRYDVLATFHSHLNTPDPAEYWGLAHLKTYVPGGTGPGATSPWRLAHPYGMTTKGFWPVRVWNRPVRNDDIRAFLEEEAETSNVSFTTESTGFRMIGGIHVERRAWSNVIGEASLEILMRDQPRE